MNPLLIFWAMIVLACLLAKRLLERTNMELSIFFAFLAILFIGTGITGIGAFYAVHYMLSSEWGQVVINFVVTALGVACIWVSARPITQIVESWLRRKTKR